MNTTAMEADNPNYVGGDIAGGVGNPFSLFLKRMPYKTPIKGVYVCSSSMPPEPECTVCAATMRLKKQ